MEEIKQLHALNLEWGCITNLMDKIISIEDKIEGGWPELADMLGDIMTEESMNKDPVSAFFHLYAYIFRLYYRLKSNPAKQPFNRWSYDEKSSLFMVQNYDYKVFVWAIRRKFDGIANDYITIPEEKLSEKERQLLKKRCK